MDLLDFEAQQLYFDEPLSERVVALLNQAAENYGSVAGERDLLRAWFMAPESLSVLVAMYRNYYYQHRLDDAAEVARRALAVSGGSIDFPADWRQLQFHHLSKAVVVSMSMVRFYLLALKALGYLQLRMGNIEEGRQMLQTVVALDSSDRLGAGTLLEVIGGFNEQGAVTDDATA